MSVLLTRWALALGLVEPEADASAPGPSEVEVGVPELVSPAADAVALTWEAPAGCPDVTVVRRALAGYLGEGPRIEAGALVRAAGKVTRRGDVYRLELRTATPSGETVRETTASDCATLVEATAVIVAVAVDPSTVLARGTVTPTPVEPEPAGEPTEPDPVAPEPAPADAPATPRVDAEPVEPAELAPPVEPRLRFAMRASGGVDLGVLPGLAGGLRLAGAIFGGRPGLARGFRAELVGDVWFPRTAFAAEGVGARVSQWSVGARGCWVPGVARASLEFPLCAGLEVGALHGDAVGERIVGPTTSNRLWLATDGSAGLAWAPRRFIALVLQAELVVPITRAGFRVGEDLEVHRADPVAGRALLGVETRFP